MPDKHKRTEYPTEQRLGEQPQLAFIVPLEQSPKFASGRFVKKAALRKNRCKVLREKEKEVLTSLLNFRISSPSTSPFLLGET